LIDELDAWGAVGLVATFWWRDDDAIEPTEQLDRLLGVAESVPIALSVIPGLAIPALAERLEGCQRITVLQHGWRHSNYSPASEANSEYPGARSATDVLRELQDGRERMSTLFGERFQSVFAPPWHGFEDKFLPLLAHSGIGSISRKGPRKHAARAARIFESNVHAAFINWTQPPTFVGERAALERILKHLRGRRLRTYDTDEPTGILTHHLVEDPPSYYFIERLAEVIGGHKAAKWLRAAEIFPRQGPT
jgi:hypothetical protein